MGTRNITRVIINGQVKVNQYCQWDGYPTGRGEEVMLFMRDVLRDGKYKEFETAIQKSVLVHLPEEGAEIFFTGAPYLPSVFDRISKEDHLSFVGDSIVKALKDKKIHLSEANFMMVASRDIGNEVTVHDVHMEPVGTGVHHALHVAAHVEGIGSQNRRGYFHENIPPNISCTSVSRSRAHPPAAAGSAPHGRGRSRLRSPQRSPSSRAPGHAGRA